MLIVERGVRGTSPEKMFTMLEVHECNFNALLDNSMVLQSQGSMIITIHRLENLQITDHKDLNLSQGFKFVFHTSQKIPLSQITDLNFAFSQITDFKKGQSHVTEKGPAPPPQLFSTLLVP